jgi:signal transduction histidine kinase
MRSLSGTQNIILLFLLLAGLNRSYAQTSEIGVPLVQNYRSSDYKGHTQNFDIAEDSLGNIYAANFAGILAFNGEQWTLVLTPDISRVSCIESDSSGNIFVGGLNEIGKLGTAENGTLRFESLLHLLPKEYQEGFGEVNNIIHREGKIFFFSRNAVFVYNGKQMKTVEWDGTLSAVFPYENKALLKMESLAYQELDLISFSLASKASFNHLDLKSIVETPTGIVAASSESLFKMTDTLLSEFPTDLSSVFNEDKINDLCLLNEDILSVGTLRGGIYFIDLNGSRLTSIDRSHGLQNDYVNKLYQDTKGRLWVALNNGISQIGFPWPWTSYGRSNGLKSGVISIIRQNGILYVGTYQGLYFYDSKTQSFQLIEGIETACWSFTVLAGELYAATSEGVFKIHQQNVVQLTDQFTLSITSTSTEPKIFAGTLDGFDQLEFSESYTFIGSRQLNNSLGQVTQVLADSQDYIWMSTLNGKVARYQYQEENLEVMDSQSGLPQGIDGRIYAYQEGILAKSQQKLLKYDYPSNQFIPFSLEADLVHEALKWPGQVFNTNDEWLWVTKGDETALSLYRKSENGWTYRKKATGPFQNFICRSVYQDEDDVCWFGGPSGLIRYVPQQSSLIQDEIRASIGKVSIGADSILVAGFGNVSALNKTYSIDYDFRNVRFDFTSSDYQAQAQIQYSSKMIGLDNKWSAWTDEPFEEYQNLSPGKYRFVLKAKDVFGNESEAIGLSFRINFPWYQKWYMITAYALFVVFLIWQITRWRLRKLLQEKQSLENIVEDRTSEIRKQRDEIQEKSSELGQALNDLKNTQDELIRKEKLASVGQMTQGIVDRIINPLNYINNFSSLSEDLAKELKEVLEDEKEKISEDGYEEILDISSMLELNLGKIKDHGTSSARIIKGMEELLKDRTGKLEELDFKELMEESFKRLEKHYAHEISEFDIALEMDLDSELILPVIQEELSKAIHELLDNAIQAVAEKSSKLSDYKGRVIAKAMKGKDRLTLNIEDNGLGIPEHEMGKIFDPFFTTKPTAKGNGVGLYLVREIIYLHQGTISVNSIPNEKTVFTIVLPLKVMNE